MRRIALYFVFLGLLLAADPALAERHHRVRPGQTLSHVARRYGVSVYDLRVHNNLRKGRALQLGQVLRVPAKGHIYVRPGQTLSHVARDHGCTIAALARANRMRPNEPLRAGQGLTLPGFAAPRHDRDWGEPDVAGRVTVLHDGQRIAVQLVDAEGHVSRRGLIALGELMGGDEEAREPHPRLGVLLATISDHFGGRPLRLVSGFREAGGFTSENSRHVSGRATDIQIVGVPRRTVWEYCRRLKGAGCGYYPNSVFTHVDARRSRTQWVDWSRPGRRPRYGTLRGPTRSKERRRRMPYPGVEGEVPLRVALAEDAFVALRPDGTPAHEVEVRMVDDHALDPHGDRDIAEPAPPTWVRVACLGDGPWVPLTPQRDPRL